MVTAIASPAHLTISKSSFSSTCWEVLKHAREAANLRRMPVIESEDLLAGLAKSDTKVGRALVRAGATYAEILSCCTFHKCDFFEKRPFSENDVVSNFTSTARNAIAKSLILADIKGTDKVTEAELFEVIAGYNDEKFTSVAILERLEINKSALWNLAINPTQRPG